MINLTYLEVLKGPQVFVSQARAPAKVSCLALFLFFMDFANKFVPINAKIMQNTDNAISKCLKTHKFQIHILIDQTAYQA
jgi:hypothetical protein